MDATTSSLLDETANVLRAGLEVIEPSWCPYQLYPKQKFFLDLPHKEALYGGSAGSAKSVALLAGALEYVDNPKYSGLILRNTYANLSKRGALMDMAYEWLSGTGAKWLDNSKTWRFPSGATIQFGYLDTDKDKYNFQGAYYHYIAFDELTQIREADYTYLMSRLRRTRDTNIPLKVRSTSNPGGEHFVWVTERFIPEDFTTVEHATTDLYEKVGLNSAGEQSIRAFVPALLKDNLRLDQESYIESLAELDPVTREQLLHGDWVIRAKGDIYPAWDEKRHVITWSEFEQVVGQRSIPSTWLHGVGLDWGSTKSHPYVVVFIARASEHSPLAGKVFIHRLLTGWDQPPRVVAERIKSSQNHFNEFPRTYVWLMSHEAKSERDTMVMDHGLPFGNWKPDRTGGIAQVRDALQIQGEDSDPFKPLLKGSPGLYCVVDDSELLYGKTDDGLARLRLEFPLYHYDARGLPYNKELNDSMDALRGVAGVFFPPIARVSDKEKTAHMLAANEQRWRTNASKEMSAEQMALLEIQINYDRQRLLKEERAGQSSGHWLDDLLRTNNV